jgi:hypothetical protein
VQASRQGIEMLRRVLAYLYLSSFYLLLLHGFGGLAVADFPLTAAERVGVGSGAGV